MASRSLVFVLLCYGGLLAGCSTQNPLYCDRAEDCTGATDYCDIDGLYHEAGLTNTCIETPTNATCNAVEQGECSTDERCLAATNPGEPGECVECLDSGDCGGAECGSDNRCAPSTCEGPDVGDQTCLDSNTSLPYCSENNVCVECLNARQCGDEDKPACDGETLACRACIENWECASGACDFGEEKCVREERIVYVDSDSGVDNGSCMAGSPCLTIEHALESVSGERTTMVIESGDYPDQVTIDKDVTIIGKGSVQINPVLPTGNEAALRVIGGVNVSISNIRIMPGAGGDTDGVALHCRDDSGDEPDLTFELGRISGSPGRGILADKCNLRLTRSRIDNNRWGGVEVRNSGFTIVNNFIVQNGTAGSGNSPFGGVFIESTDGLGEVLDFNTIVANHQQSISSPAAVRCNATALTANNNILMNDVGENRRLTNDQCSFSYSIFDAEASDAEVGTNIKTDASFVAVGGLTFRLDPSSRGVGEADPAATLAIDFDGEPRPQGSAANRDIGADEVGDP